MARGRKKKIEVTPGVQEALDKVNQPSKPVEEDVIISTVPIHVDNSTIK